MAASSAAEWVCVNLPHIGLTSFSQVQILLSHALNLPDLRDLLKEIREL